MLEYMALNERREGELFKKYFRKLLSLEWKYFKKTLIKESVFQNIKQKHNTEKTIGCFTETIGCLYQLSNNKTEFKEIGKERLYTDVYTSSLQIEPKLLFFVFCSLLASFLNAAKASLFDSKKRVQVYLEKSSTITRA